LDIEPILSQILWREVDASSFWHRHHIVTSHAPAHRRRGTFARGIDRADLKRVIPGHRPVDDINRRVWLAAACNQVRAYIIADNRLLRNYKR
jgi:hypothetical protein